MQEFQADDSTTVRAEEKHKGGGKHYPFSQCEADRRADGYSAESAKKICGAIKARGGHHEEGSIEKYECTVCNDSFKREEISGHVAGHFNLKKEEKDLTSLTFEQYAKEAKLALIDEALAPVDEFLKNFPENERWAVVQQMINLPKAEARNGLEKCPNCEVYGFPTDDAFNDHVNQHKALHEDEELLMEEDFEFACPYCNYDPTDELIQKVLGDPTMTVSQDSLEDAAEILNDHVQKVHGKILEPSDTYKQKLKQRLVVPQQGP